MKMLVTGESLVLMPESAAEVAALARWRNGREGQAVELLPVTGPGATLRFSNSGSEAATETILTPAFTSTTTPTPPEMG